MSDLFPIKVPVTVVSGEYSSGKTMFALTTGYPLERVLLYDNELSAETYHTGDNPFTRVDLADDLIAQHPDGFTAQQFYEAWRDHMRGVSRGRYDVIAVDTIEPIEEGLTDWVRRNPSAFGHTANQYAQMSGIMWGDVKSLWKRHIQEMKARCQMVVLIAHMRDEYKGNKRTGRRERRGKETLSELATLELELVRKPGQLVPSARVLKERFFHGTLDSPGQIKPILDPWVEECTWARIRGYMEKPADPDNPVLPPAPDPEEREMERLRLQATIAEAELAKLERDEVVPEQRPAATAGGNGKVSHDVQFWRRAREQLKAAGCSVSNPLAEIKRLAEEDGPWSGVLQAVEARDWAAALSALDGQG